jgi:hypothetical protein
VSRSDAALIARAKQYGLPLATLENRILRPDRLQDLERLVPEDFARRHSVLPLFVDRDLLAVALADPGEAALAALRRLTGKALQPFIARPEELAAALDRFYGKT